MPRSDHRASKITEWVRAKLLGRAPRPSPMDVLCRQLAETEARAAERHTQLAERLDVLETRLNRLESSASMTTLRALRGQRALLEASNPTMPLYED